ncbi:MAG: hypothetical protein KAT15_23275, partial [Bacteroidales bacterium]|nr:hypothetical protein [Bacteroidales bacterium]
GFRPGEHPASGGLVEWSCPSNIAIVKYWGKKPLQVPLNPSLSLTLQEARTSMRVEYRYDPENADPGFRFTFEGKESPAFGERIRQLIRSLEPFMPFLAWTSLTIDSEITFPHSSGIASSASAMGALAMCLVTMDEKIKGRGDPENRFKKASFMARLGSGSASRSIHPGFALWGVSEAWPGSNDEYALPVTGFHPTFGGMKDSILIVESGRKRISSSAGHGLMDTNPYAATRFQQARANLVALKQILMEGDWNGFISVMEEEALSLHAMMMTGKPGYLLMQPGTLSILNRVRDIREETGIPVGFTLDAGANVHLLYAADQETSVKALITSELQPYCENNRVIHDKMGEGPVREYP